MALFNMEGGFWRFMNRLVDVFVLNFLWVVFSIPIITIGASTCAAFYVTLKMVDEEEGYVGRMFIKAFKANFKQGTLAWLFTAPCIYAGYLIWQMIIVDGDTSFIIILGAILYSALVTVTFLYTYPMIARYENSLRRIIKNSIAVSVMYFKRTLLLIFLVALELAIIFWNRYTMLVSAFIGPEFIIFTVSAISKRIFQRIEDKTDETTGTING